MPGSIPTRRRTTPVTPERDCRCASAWPWRVEQLPWGWSGVGPITQSVASFKEKVSYLNPDRRLPRKILLGEQQLSGEKTFVKIGSVQWPRC